MLAAYIFYWLQVEAAFNPLLAALISVLFVVAVGLLTQFFIERISGYELLTFILTFLFAVVIASILSRVVTAGVTFLIIPPLIRGAVTLMDTNIPWQFLLSLFMVFVIIILFWVIQFKTSLGVTLRAVAQDMEIASLLGISRKRVMLYGNLIATALAGLAGIVVAPLYAWESTMWLHPLIVLLAITILGGLGSFYGCILGSFVIGFIETAVVILLPQGAYLRDVAAMSFALAILLIRPRGLRGVEL
jgi:branched-chain amino acid transport system permease protein